MRALEPSKYCDFNLKNIAYGREDRYTFEVRIFPAYTEAGPILAAAALFEGILRICCDEAVIPSAAPKSWVCSEVIELLDRLPLQPEQRQYWRKQAEQRDS